MVKYGNEVFDSAPNLPTPNLRGTELDRAAARSAADRATLLHLINDIESSEHVLNVLRARDLGFDGPYRIIWDTARRYGDPQAKLDLRVFGRDQAKSTRPVHDLDTTLALALGRRYTHRQSAAVARLVYLVTQEMAVGMFHVLNEDGS